VGSRGSAEFCIRVAASVPVVQRVAYPSRAVRCVGIGDVWLVCLVVRIKLMVGRERGRGSGGRRHCVVSRRAKADVETLLLFAGGDQARR
jgi:hypothetical protein